MCRSLWACVFVFVCNHITVIIYIYMWIYVCIYIYIQYIYGQLSQCQNSEEKDSCSLRGKSANWGWGAGGFRCRTSLSPSIREVHRGDQVVLDETEKRTLTSPKRMVRRIIPKMKRQISYSIVKYCELYIIDLAIIIVYPEKWWFIEEGNHENSLHMAWWQLSCSELMDSWAFFTWAGPRCGTLRLQIGICTSKPLRTAVVLATWIQ